MKKMFTEKNTHYLATWEADPSWNWFDDPTRNTVAVWNRQLYFGSINQFPDRQAGVAPVSPVSKTNRQRDQKNSQQ